MIGVVELIALALAGGVSAVAPIFVKPLLIHVGVVDVPNERSSHEKPTLRGVGIAQLLGIICAGLVLVFYFGTSSNGLIVGTVLLAAILTSILGLVDDIKGTRGLSPLVRLTSQLMIGIAVAVYLALIMGVGSRVLLLGIALIGAFVFAAYTNITNFMDGINGISGMHAVVAGVTYALIGFVTGLEWLQVIGLLLAIVYLVFLPWNLLKPGAFLGDVGSYLLGAIIGSTFIVGVLSNVPWLTLVGPLVIYLCDTTITAGKRLLKGQDILKSHHEHVYQQLLEKGMSHIHVALIVTGLSIITGGLGSVVLWRPNTIYAVSVVVCMLLIVAVYFSIPLWSRKVVSYANSLSEVS